MRFLYSILMYLLTPFILIRLWWKGKSLPAYRERIAERFGLAKQPKRPIDVWLHAVSLGEVIAAIPLIEAMLAKSWAVLVTTMTPTGSTRVFTHFGDQVSHQYIPYDLPLILRRFFKDWQPAVGVIMETELWPNLIYEAKAAQVPLLLANARLSNRSHKGYMRLRFLFKSLLKQFSAILTQSSDDASRFIALGAPVSAVHVLGNMKFDVKTQAITHEIVQKIKENWGTGRTVVIAASTHEGEEEAILLQWKRIQEAIPGVLLLIAPRHPERFVTVFKLCAQLGFDSGLRSEIDTISADNEVIVLDSLGELLAWYQISQYAFVGGSLVSLGGHNVLEPIAVKTPVFSGNQVANFKAICQDLQEAEAIRLVADARELIEAIIQMHQDEASRKQIIANATEVLERNRGAVSKHMDYIEKILASSKA
ncbi:MAG: 3-deoxy-D-manno-octulosonic acid transferase [Legionella sp.]|nr:MAG: 3-deoxy-D-manno-octulosonic acid transferase [Legionella sp.]